MPATINDLPYELISQILELAILFNAEQNSRKCDLDLRLHAAPDPDIRMTRQGGYALPPDSIRWDASNAIRQVNSRWHALALEYAFKEMFILAWRGNERYLPSGVLRAKSVEHLRLADSLGSRPFLRKTAGLFEHCPTLSLSYVRRIWFDGYYDAEESAIIFAILRRCKKLEDIFLPWTALRHGTVADWSNLFGYKATRSSISSLKIQVMDFPKRSPATKKEHLFDNEALEYVSVDFTRLTSLRFLGRSSFVTITDKDLIAIARTAINLRELYMSSWACLGVSPKGVGALIRSSRLSLEVLDLEGLSNMESSEAEHHGDYSHIGLSQLVAQCPLLRILRLRSIRTCRDIFLYENIAWRGKVQIWYQAPQSDEDDEILFQILDQARDLMASRKRSDEETVDVEIVTAIFVFEPRCSLVHGDYQRAHHFREPWVAEKKESHKTVQMVGYVRAFPYCITEDEFKDGFDKGHVWL